MMGRLSGDQAKLFYEFNLDDRIPEGHLLRKIDAIFDVGDLHRRLAPFYSHTGRPSIDPELMVRMLIVGYCYGIRSERMLCEEVLLNLAYRWFCRLGLEDEVPHHSTFSKNRHGRFRESDLFRDIFENVVRRCMEAGLVGGEEFAIDASVIEANASRDRRVDGRLTTVPDEQDISRAVREYLDALEKAASEENAKSDVDGDGAPSGGRPVEPQATSLTDPAAAWTNRGRTKALFAYATNYLIDTKAAIIVDVQETPARWSAEVAATKTMLTRTRDTLGLTPQFLAADTAYGSGIMLGWLLSQRIEPHIPIIDREHQTNGYFTRADFTFDEASNSFLCPGGNRLHYVGRVRDDGTMAYRARTKDCRECALKARCTPGSRRAVTRNFYEAEREYVRGLKGTPAFERSARLRKKAEMRFAHLKVNQNFRRLRLRGPTGASDEFLLVATAQNLRKHARFLGCDPPAGDSRAA